MIKIVSIHLRKEELLMKKKSRLVHLKNMTTDLLHTFAIFLGLAKWFGTCLLQLSRAFGRVENYSYETNYHSKLVCHDEKT